MAGAGNPAVFGAVGTMVIAATVAGPGLAGVLAGGALTFGTGILMGTGGMSVMRPCTGAKLNTQGNSTRKRAGLSSSTSKCKGTS